MKTLVAFAALAMTIAAAPAFAAGPRACLLSDISPTALACSGFYAGNLLNNSKIDEQKTGLLAIGFAWDGIFANVSKISNLNGATTIDFSTAAQNPLARLYGETWIGAHFGNGANLGGQATGFWKFDAGVAGLQTFMLKIAKGSSNIVVYKTGTAEEGGGGGGGIGSTVPEPGSWALMIAGFGLTGAAMRRRNARAALA